MEIWIIITLIAATTDPAVSGAEKMKSVMGISGPAISGFPMRYLSLLSGLAVDAVNRTKSSPNHADVLALGQYWRTDAGDFHGASNNSVQP